MSKRTIVWLACTSLLAACSDSAPGNGGTNGGEADGGGQKVCRYIGDPDRGGISYICEEVWDCETLPNAQNKCVGTYGTPDGSGGWKCHHDGEHIVCEKGEPNAVGGSSWSCEGDTCTGGTGGSGASSGGTTPGSGLAPGSGGWVCVTNAEFGTTVCTSQGENDVPTTASGAPAPAGGGTYGCTIDAEFIKCESEGGTPSDAGPGPSPDATGPAPDSGTVTGTGGGLTPGGGIVGGGTPCFCPVDPGAAGLPPNVPLAKITSKIVTAANGRQALRARCTYSTAFCDNTYGVNSIGWSPKRGHRFGDLVGSDHQVLYFHDCNGRNVVTVKLDYITADTNASSGYSCLGPFGGDGSMIQGNPDHVAGWESSLGENFNTFGYVLTQDSPATDDNYTPNPQYPNWTFEMWYQADIDLAAFGSSGPCRVTLLSLHASPAKTALSTIEVEPCPCI